MTSVTFFFIFIPILAIILLAVNLIFAPHNPYQEKDSAFECGFHSFLGQNRTQFSISFFIFALLFLLFDLEILLVYPYVVSAYTNAIYGLVIMLAFFLALTLGFAFELGKNALKIDSRQMLVLSKNNSNLVTNISGFEKIHKHIERHFTLKNFVVAFISLSIVILLRYIINGGMITDPLQLKDAYILGITSIISKLSIKTIVDFYFDKYELENILSRLRVNMDCYYHKMKMGENVIIDKKQLIKTFNCMDNKKGEGSSSTRCSPIPIEDSDHEYWVEQGKLYERALSSWGKDERELTREQLEAKWEFKKINRYDLASLQEGLAETMRNVNLPTDSETVRQVKVLEGLIRDADHRTPAYRAYLEKEKMIERNKAIAEAARLEALERDKVMVRTGLDKLKKIIEYNTSNKKAVPMDGMIPANPDSQLTRSELDAFINIINKDDKATLDITSRIFNNSLTGTINQDSKFIKYFEDITKK